MVVRAAAALVAAALWLMAAHAIAAEPANPYPQVATAYLVLVNGEPLWGQAVDEPLPPASLTKLMTAWLVVRNTKPDDVVTISTRAGAAGGSRLGLKRGDRATVGNLLRAMLVMSANDACVALSEFVAGSEEAFVVRMNEEARQLKFKRTHYRNACGLDLPGHVATARELLQLTQTVLTDPAIAETVAMTEAAVTVNGKERRIHSSNLLLGSFPGTKGVKTGSTGKAGKCLVALVVRDGTQVLAAFLHTRDRWWDAAGVIELAFERQRKPVAQPAASAGQH